MVQFSLAGITFRLVAVGILRGFGTWRAGQTKETTSNLVSLVTALRWHILVIPLYAVSQCDVEIRNTRIHQRYSYQEPQPS